MQQTNDASYDASSTLKGEAPATNPPSYDYATGASSSTDAKARATNTDQPKPGPVPKYTAAPDPSFSPAGDNLHHYQHATGHVISTPLPPDHPEMICLQEGRHISASRFGILGILAAVFWFPLGIGLCLLDRRVVCRRCGRIIDDGISC
ncbi:uncharacterized protein FOMMEDRAFT_85845 [Fomitiporia mediterranea MF3/22]|uniref:uncharacterized protein n=1 Tax=Fomitiporia mediterranea (strain MF3/22) TaxID=694068 RepID=UPI0004409A84|nr:uncharacterized protein FOMMEDRAFT_85845 [Fomitiporia mediterranea MF3/22]EJD02661.1 hypothetical protein FOMMEDRAFT_85845 [Fomitiporia mediterranea MF3/22]